MDELIKMLKDKLDNMRKGNEPNAEFSFMELSQVYQAMCMMKQIVEIAKWADGGYK